MKSISLVTVLLSGFLFQANIATAGCQKTMMGSDCTQMESATASHMRENALDSAKAQKAVKEAMAQAKKEAKKVSAK